MSLPTRLIFAIPTAACTLALLVFPATASWTTTSSPAGGVTPGFARAVLLTAAGEEVGRATFADRNGKVVISTMVNGLPPDFHGFHVHGTGLCEGPDFMSAGGHFNPDGLTHPSHAGDLSSLYVAADGTAELRTVTDRFAVSDLLDGKGTALVVHANRDNYANIPTRYVPTPDAMTLATGDAGGRLACGVIESADTLQPGDPGV